MFTILNHKIIGDILLGKLIANKNIDFLLMIL